jgi:hypothetical protein
MRRLEEVGERRLKDCKARFVGWEIGEVRAWKGFATDHVFLGGTEGVCHKQEGRRGGRMAIVGEIEAIGRGLIEFLGVIGFTNFPTAMIVVIGI